MMKDILSRIPSMGFGEILSKQITGVKSLLTIILLVNNFIFSQNCEWMNFTSSIYVTSLVNDTDNLWIGTYGGLIKLDKNTEELSFFNKANSKLPGNSISSLALDTSQNIWLGTRYNGVGKLAENKCSIYNTQNSGLPSDQWNTKIKIDNKGNIWIGSFKYLAKFDGTNWTAYETGDPISSSTNINDIYFDQKGNTWIGASWGLGKFVNDSLIENFGGFDKKEVKAILSDTANSLWVGTLNDGLFKYDGISWTVYDTTTSEIPSNNIYTMKFDNQGNLWLGTNKGFVKGNVIFYKFNITY